MQITGPGLSLPRYRGVVSQEVEWLLLMDIQASTHPEVGFYYINSDRSWVLVDGQWLPYSGCDVVLDLSVPFPAAFKFFVAQSVGIKLASRQAALLRTFLIGKSVVLHLP